MLDSRKARLYARNVLRRSLSGVRNAFGWQIEKSLLRGSLKPSSSHASILHFGVNRGGTQYTKEILSRCARENGLIHVRLNEYAFATDFPFVDSLSAEEVQAMKHIFFENGFLYSVFGGMIEGIDNLQCYKNVLLVRDPRDVLVSRYFSLSFSHPVPFASSKSKQFLSDREAVRSMSVDEFVIAESGRLLGTYTKYINLLVGHGAYITKYENMICQFPQWLDELLVFCELEISKSLKSSLLASSIQADTGAREDKFAHRRKGLPKDYRQKLQDETISTLNEKFAGVLAAFQYEQ